MPNGVQGDRLVLVGAGHAHLALVRRLAMAPIRSIEVTLVTPLGVVPYSGMVPGWMSGHYPLSAIRVDWRPWIELAGIRWIADHAVGMDAGRRCVGVSGGAHVEYDLLSLDVGSESDPSWLGAAGSRLLPLRPIHEFVDRWPAVVEAAAGERGFHAIVVGGGAAGVEIACAAQQAFRSRRLAATVSLVTSDRGLLPDTADGARGLIARILHNRGVQVFRGPGVGHEAGVLLGSGESLSADCVIAATDARAPCWLGRSGLALSRSGHARVNAALQSVSHPNVFAAGDVSGHANPDVQRSGVHAVRAGPVLAGNLVAILEGRALGRYRPRRRSLYLLSTGPRHAVAIWGSLSRAGTAYWHWKDRIDRRFIARNTLMQANRDFASRSLRVRCAQILSVAIRPGIVRTALRVSLVVGTLLNLINQGGALLGKAPPDWLHIALNYVVPYCVASYSGASTELAEDRHHGNG